ncbi:zinc-binding alcohol dehydrogenase family protein [soil metagenome]
MTSTMRAWAVVAPGPIGSGVLRLSEKDVPTLRSHDVLVEVDVCGVCRTDLHVCEGDLPQKRPEVTPGHQVIGRVKAVGSEASRFAIGERIGVAWLRSTCRICDWCRDGRENLCRSSTYTGWDEDGGFAEFTAVPEQFAYRLPAGYSDEEVAPLLCAGIIGYRALKRARVPSAGRLGILGFGSSAHITLQIAIAQGVEVHVMTRGARNRDLALEMGAASVGDAFDRATVPLDSAIIFAPNGDLLPRALECLRPGGTVALAGIHMSDIPVMSYTEHLFDERDVRSVTSNTRQDGEELMRLAERIPLDIRTTAYGFESLPQALADIKASRHAGSSVVRVSQASGARNP